MKQEFQIKGELITLDALLKAVGAADSGAHAKAMVAEGLVRVDGEVELRKTRKLRGGERGGARGPDPLCSRPIRHLPPRD